MTSGPGTGDNRPEMTDRWQPDPPERGWRGSATPRGSGGRPSRGEPTEGYRPAGPGEDTAEWARMDWPAAESQELPAEYPDERYQPEDYDDPAPLVRPYARTGGRTRANLELALETLISTTNQGLAVLGQLAADQAAICQLCREPTSVAEVGARMRVPLGVARVLISDLAGEGLVLVHDSAAPADGPSLDFMERVLVGLRNL
jgi:hypothetical protein